AGVCRPTDVLIVVSGQGSVNSVRTMRLPAGFSRIPVDFLPSTASQDNLRMDIYSVDNGSIESCHISFSWPEEASERLETVVFRDRITPGASEMWRIRLCSRGDSAVLKSAAVATMYNAALENLVDDNWAGRFSLKDFSGYINSNTLGTSPYSRSMRVDASNDDRYRGIGNIQWPDWRFLSQVIMIRGMASSRKYAAAAGGGVNNMIMSEASVTVAADMDSAADAESEEECSAVPESAPASDETDYRQADVLQAFWMPSLVSDDEGNIDIVFTVPNANGTWRFRSFAWSHRAESAALSLRALANKPVMVQPNLPRYLRQGDSARLLATVYNNSDADAEVETTVEIFDIASGAVLESSATSALIAAGASAIVPVDMAAPTDKAAVGYRVRSRLGSFSDGEQTVIPILPSSATVIESTEFYLNPGDTAPFTLTVPASGDATLTLQYCQNPVWTMVKAMRGLGGGDGLTSVGISGRLFSALAARKVIADNPQVASVISQWKDNPSEEALTSMP
ncbi:MAG: hypothetical protein K2F63_02330, partial [Muribaculaceae bacterium]|nr:hypothetical protein [Muribaculaceae bacterium]